MRQKYAYLIIVLLLGTAILSIWSAPDDAASAQQLYSRCVSLLFKERHADLVHTATALVSKSQQEHNRKLEGYGWFYHGAGCLYGGKAKDGNKSLHKALNIANELKDDSLQAITLNTIGVYEVMTKRNNFIGQHYFLKAIEHAKRAKQISVMTSAYGNLAEVAYLKRDTTGLTYSFIGYNLGQKYKNTRATFIGAGHLAQFFLLKGNLTEAEKYINVYMGIAAKNGYDKSFGHLLSSRVLTQQGNLDMAEREAAKALALARESLNSMVPECLVQHATVLARKGNYSKSNEELEEALHTSNEMSIHQFVVEIYTLMSRNYEKMGNIRSALAYSQAALDTAQSISISDKQHILSERDLAMQLVQKEQEAILYKQKLRSHRNVSIMLTVTAALLLTLFIFVAISLHRRNVLYKNIVRQNRAAIGKEKEMKRQIQELKDKSIQSGTQELTDGSGDLQRIKTDNMEAEGSSTLKSATLDKLYDRLCSMMESERLYTDNQLNRDTLAKMLGTNHTYLTKVIMQKTQMSYPQYINSYRINDAIRVLSDPNQPDYPLKQLCFDLGFNSQSTFHKLFKAQVGLSPSAYRDFVKKA